jgi:hypothetical protein
MTWRGFIIGILVVAAISLLEPYWGMARGWGGFISTSFPSGAVVVLVCLSVGVNVLLKLVRRAWALRQSELMLVWCMLTAGATMIGDSPGRFLYPLIAGPPYLGRRTDLLWTDGGALTYAPPGLLLSNDPKSMAAQQYYEGAGEEGRVPWRYWVVPLAHWSALLLLVALAVFFLTAMLRRQWVESERLMFPLARVPLEFSEESAEGGGLLPRLFAEKGFLVGLVAAAAFRLLRAVPLFFGADSTVALSVPMHDILAQTPLEPMDFDNIELWPSAVGFAYLVPADVSLSIWFFYFFARLELQAVSWFGLPEYGSTYGSLMRWQQAGAYIAFTVGMLFMARRHLWVVARKALGLLRGVDDSEEPVSYGVAFWGLIASLIACLIWHRVHGMWLLTAAAVLGLIFCWYLVYARIVAQAGLYVGRTVWVLPELVHGMSGGRAFNGAGAVIAEMHDPLLVTGGTAFLAPIAMNAFRISEVLEKPRRRLLLPAMLVAMVIALACGTYTYLGQAYEMGGSNMSDPWTQRDVPLWAFGGAQRIIKQPSQSAEAYWGPLGIGLVGMTFLMFMRARFYWWPVHSIGLLSCSSWHANRLWLPFLLGWLTKMGIMKMGSGRLLRDARFFFIALIVVEAFVGGVSTVVRTLTKGAVPDF